MKKIHITILLASVCLFGACKSVQQIDVPTTAQSKDSITSDKDNLLLLIERAYLASKAFKTGVYRYNDTITAEEHKKNLEDTMRRSKENGYIISPSLDWNKRKDYPAMTLLFIKDGKEHFLSEDEIKKISPDDIESIELGVGLLATVAYGAIGNTYGVIKIKLKE